MSQTTNLTSMPAGIRGLVGTDVPAVVRSYAAEAALTFGRYVTKGSDAVKEVNVPSDASHIQDLANIRGVVVRTHVQNENSLQNSTEVAINDVVNVLEKGDIWVYIETAVTPDDPVFVRYVAGVGEVAGSFRNDADGGDAVELPGARFVTSGSAAGQALLHLG